LLDDRAYLSRRVGDDWLTKTCHLVLMHKWFDAIARGEKTVEYRLADYWSRRILGCNHVVFHRGYTTRTMTFEIASIAVTGNQLEIHLGKRLDGSCCPVCGSPVHATADPKRDVCINAQAHNGQPYFLFRNHAREEFPEPPLVPFLEKRLLKECNCEG